MPEINRRRFLINTATAGAAVAVAVPAAEPAMAMPGAVNIVPKASPDIETAFKAVTDARRELVAAKDARDWLADEWRHLWPRAPESMRWYGFMSGTFETDIVDRSMLDDSGKAIKIKSSKEVSDHRALMEHPRPLRANASARVKERAEQWRQTGLADVEEMEAYLAETEKLREAAGSGAVIARVREAEKDLDRAISALMEVPVANVADLHIKARAALISSDSKDFTPEMARCFPILGAFVNVVFDVIALAEGGAA
ncbi:hypothetical protein ASD64_11470 [Mesorhizobium sp. Root157]|nr:hypothetical protein ASD64_11470 [Mesorhizobium sp. Root157]